MTFQPTHTECTDPSCYWCHSLNDAMPTATQRYWYDRAMKAEADLASARAENERLTGLVEKAMERQKHWRYVFDLLTGNKGGKNVGQVISDHLDWLENVAARTVDG